MLFKLYNKLFNDLIDKVYKQVSVINDAIEKESVDINKWTIVLNCTTHTNYEL